jgi:arylsulfatase
MKLLYLIVVLCLGSAAPLAAAPALSTKPPNIILILTDDQGYGDLSCHGNPILKTPHIDRIHREGVRFADFHVSPTCAPTRSALMTGRHEFRNGVTHTILERERLTLDAVTLPQVLHDAGYTTGIFGKWHLGDEAPYRPIARGFDEQFIHGAGGIGQSYAGSCGDAPGNTYFSPLILHNDKFVKTDGYCTDVFFKQATTWIESVKGKKPFYCHIATNAPHAPLDVPKEDEARYAGQKPDVAKFFGMIANIDDNVGRLLAKLAAWDIERDTLVIYISDNGGTVGTKVFNAGMRGSKVTPWLGGTRASSLWRWPGTLEPHDADALTAHIDFLPTLAEIAGATLNEKAKTQAEGRSLVPLLKDAKATWEDRVLFTHVGRWPKGTDPEKSKYTWCSVRDPRWHLVNNDDKGEKKWQLFDVKADPGEAKNIAADHADIVARLDAAYDAWWKSVRPQMVNEDAKQPAMNAFKEIYVQQFGEPPTKGK